MSLATTHGSSSDVACPLRECVPLVVPAGAAMRLAQPEGRSPAVARIRPLQDANHTSDSAAYYRNVDAVWPKVIGHR